MSTPIYYIREGSLKFADKLLFDKLEVYLYAGDKICLIGANGSGKSSLLKVIAGEYELDNGTVYQHNNVTIGYLKQEATAQEISILQFILPKPDAALDAQSQIILSALGLDSSKLLTELSGGQLRRVHLAKILIDKPDILLLDEPTNHLDVRSIEWLEQYIKDYRGAVICISHDRAFLSNVTNKLWWLDRGLLRQNDQGFASFEAWQDEIIADEARILEKLHKKLDAENLWRQQGVTARRKRNQGRLAALHALRQKLREQQYKTNQSKAQYNVQASTGVKRSQFIIEAEDLCFYYNAHLVIDHLNLRIKKGEKIGIAGANGSGKTTLIKLLVGELTPAHGTVRRGEGLEISYSDQHRSGLDLQATLWEILCPHGGDQIVLPDNRSIHVGAYLKNFLFDPKLMRAKVATLSGGERNRLLVAKTLINPGNLLILDEPTNDLDMDSLDMLLEVLSDYKGTLLIVSHDRDFLNRLVTRTILFDEDNKIHDFIGGYEDYQAFKSTKPISSKTYPKQITPQDQRSDAKPKKLSYKHQRLLAILPSELEELERTIAAIEQKLLINPGLFIDDHPQFLKLTEQLQSAKELYEEKFSTLISIEEEEAALSGAH